MPRSFFVLAGLVLLLGLVAVPAHADDGDAARSSGADRFETAAQVSSDVFDPGEVDRAYLATGFEFADALTAGGPAAVDGSPVLLTREDRLPQATADELDRLGVDELVAVGGSAAIDDAVLDEAEQHVGSVSRVWGQNRYETASELATQLFDADDVDAVYVAYGEDFADALSAVTAAARFDAPLLLTGQASLPATSSDALDQLDPDRVVLAGGTAVIDQGVEAELEEMGIEVDRQSGANRFQTAATLAREHFLGAREIVLANGLDFPDAIPGAAAAARLGSPLLLVTQNDLPAVTSSTIQDLNPRQVRVIGGSAVVSPDVAHDAGAVERTALAPGEVPDFAFLRFDSSASPTIRSAAVGTFDGSVEELSNSHPEEQHSPSAFSPDGEWLLYRRAAEPGVAEEDVEEQVRLVSVEEGSASTRILSDGDERDCSLSNLHFDPTGEQVAFVCEDAADDDAESIGISDLDGDTTWIDDAAFQQVRIGEGGELFVVRDAGDGEELRERDLTSPEAEGDLIHSVDEGTLQNLQVSDDGSQIAMTHVRGDSTTRGDDASILVIDLDTGSVTELLADADGDAAMDEHQLRDWHPDGDQVLVATGGYDGSGESTLRLVSIADDTDQTIVAEPRHLDEDTINRAEVSPDGGFVFYSNPNRSGSVFNRPSVWLYDLESEQRTTVDLPSGFGGPGLPLLNPAAFADGGPNIATSSECFETDTGTTFDGSNQAVDEPRADVVEVCVEYGADEVEISTQVDEPTDPLSDAGWAQAPDDSDAPWTSVVHDLNVTGEEFGPTNYSVTYRLIEFEGTERLDVRVDNHDENIAEWCTDDSDGSYEDGWYVVTLGTDECFDEPDSIGVSTLMTYRTGPSADAFARDRHPGQDGFFDAVAAP
ncbi:cell wall-binding repeat-containing protein [Egibacter rhizosphaerae]|nr:cell wall-binding repeat-containing protein [Egibacter rhizosphaerae]